MPYNNPPSEIIRFNWYVALECKKPNINACNIKQLATHCFRPILFQNFCIISGIICNKAISNNPNRKTNSSSNGPMTTAARTKGTKGWFPEKGSLIRSFDNRCKASATKTAEKSAPNEKETFSAKPLKRLMRIYFRFSPPIFRCKNTQYQSSSLCVQSCLLWFLKTHKLPELLSPFSRFM